MTGIDVPGCRNVGGLRDPPRLQPQFIATGNVAKLD